MARTPAPVPATATPTLESLAESVRAALTAHRKALDEHLNALDYNLTQERARVREARTSMTRGDLTTD